MGKSWGFGARCNCFGICGAYGHNRRQRRPGRGGGPDGAPCRPRFNRDRTSHAKRCPGRPGFNCRKIPLLRLLQRLVAKPWNAHSGRSPDFSGPPQEAPPCRMLEPAPADTIPKIWRLLHGMTKTSRARSRIAARCRPGAGPKPRSGPLPTLSLSPILRDAIRMSRAGAQMRKRAARRTSGSRPTHACDRRFRAARRRDSQPVEGNRHATNAMQLQR